MYKKILVPLDGSPLAEMAIPHAEALAKSEHAEIIILRVVATPASEFLTDDPNITSLIIQNIEKETASYVHDKVAMLEKENLRVTGITRGGSVPDIILDVADETYADVITMSTHGRTGLSCWLMGSVADKVVHHAHIPVMLIHPN